MDRGTLLLLFGAMVLVRCGGDPVPKPKGWIRLDLPEKAYVRWSPPCPFSADIPAYAQVIEASPEEQSCWYNLRFPGQRAVVHLTYKPVRDRLEQLIMEAHDLKNKHESMA